MLDVPSSNDSGSSSDSSAIIGGAAGGVILLLLMIIVVLCVVILCTKRSHRKGMFPMGYDEAFYIATKLNTAVTTQHNPSYDVTKIDAVDHLYDTCTGSDVPVSFKPSCNVPTELYSKTTEDEYNYVQPNEFTQHSNLDADIKLEINPSYGVSRGKDRATPASSETVTKYNTKADDSSHNATIEQHEVQLLHQNTTTNTTYLTLIGTDKSEYNVINQLKSDDLNYETINDNNGSPEIK